MCGMNRGRDAPRALWDNKTVCLATQDGNDSPTHPSVLLSCELTSAQAAFIMLGAGLCTTPFLFLWVLRWHCRTSGVFPPAPERSSFCLEADYSASSSCLDRSSGTTVCLCVTTLHEPAPQNPVSSHRALFLEGMTISSIELFSIISSCFLSFPLQKIFVTQKVLRISQAHQRCQWGRPILKQWLLDHAAAHHLCRFPFLSQVRS